MAVKSSAPTVRRAGSALAVVIFFLSLLAVAVPPSEAKTKPQRSGRCAKHAHQVAHHPHQFLDCEPDQLSGGAVRADFNGDGIGDLAAGVPADDPNGVTDSGAVVLLYGSVNGLVASGPDRRWTDASTGGSLGTSDRFGAALAAGDFNGDGRSDLAIGIPGQDAPSTAGAPGTDRGAVRVLYAGPGGLSATGAQTFVGDEADDRFGSVLGWGQLGRGPQADLVVGVPLANGSRQIPDTGEVHVLYGAAGGLTATGRQVLTRPAGADDRFGASLATLDYQGGPEAELAVGTPLAGRTDRGRVDLFHAGAAGLQFAVSLTDPRVQDGDQFGFSLAGGDVDGVAKDDLVIGVPFNDLFNGDFAIPNAGIVLVRPSTATGLATSAILVQQSTGTDGSENGDQYGRAVAANDFNGDGLDDLAVGIPFENVGTVADAGAVHVVNGAPTGPVSGASTSRFLRQGPTGDPGAQAQTGDRFGSSLSAWNFGRGPQADLAVGVPFDDKLIPGPSPLTLADTGAIDVYYGSATGIPTTFDIWFEGQFGDGAITRAGNQLGSVLY